MGETGLGTGPRNGGGRQFKVERLKADPSQVRFHSWVLGPSCTGTTWEIRLRYWSQQRDWTPEFTLKLHGSRIFLRAPCSGPMLTVLTSRVGR